MKLPLIEPRPDLYDEAERWSVDELRARQLERLQWSVRHAFDHVEHYRKAFEDRGVHPDDIRSLEDTRLLPFTSKADLRANYPFGMFAVPREQVSRVHASSGTTGKPTVVGYTARGPADVVVADGPVDPRSRGPSRRRPPRGLRLRPVHRRARRALRRGGARLHRRAGLRRADRAAGPADHRLRAARDHGDAVVLPVGAGRDGAGGHRPARDLPGGRHLRRRAVDAGDAGRDRGAGRAARGRHLRPVRGDGARRGAGVRREQGRAAHLGGPLLPRGGQPADRRAGRRGPGR